MEDFKTDGGTKKGSGDDIVGKTQGQDAVVNEHGCILYCNHLCHLFWLLCLIIVGFVGCVCVFGFLLVSLLLILLRHSFLSLDFWLFFFSGAVLFLLFCVLCSFNLLLVPPASHLLSLSSSPGPQVRLKRNTNETTTMWFSLPFGELCQNVLCAKLLLVFSFAGLLVVHSTCIC